ncbi:MAG: shikimate kinase [Acidimicrobiales bacterium]|jgi:shikimate kinase
MGEHVLLVGMMGSGKSTVGRIVAEHMGRPFCDSDAEVERRSGRSVPEIFAERGERAFRAEERAALGSVLACPVPSVIGVAGGAVLEPETRRRMRSAGLIIWLDVAPQALAARVGAGRGRPLLEVDPMGTLRRLDAIRRPVYRELSDYVVHAERRSPAALAEVVVRLARAHLETASGAQPW